MWSRPMFASPASFRFVSGQTSASAPPDDAHRSQFAYCSARGAQHAEKTTSAFNKRPHLTWRRSGRGPPPGRSPLRSPAHYAPSVQEAGAGSGWNVAEYVHDERTRRAAES